MKKRRIECMLVVEISPEEVKHDLPLPDILSSISPRSPKFFRTVDTSGSTSASSVQAALKMSQKYWYVYLLLCDQKTFYIGMTDQPTQRLIQHKSKSSFYTKKFSDIKLVYCEKYLNKYDAAKREKQLKGWSRTKKQMLINGTLGYNTCTELVEKLSRV